MCLYLGVHIHIWMRICVYKNLWHRDFAPPTTGFCLHLCAVDKKDYIMSFTPGIPRHSVYYYIIYKPYSICRSENTGQHTLQDELHYILNAILARNGRMCFLSVRSLSRVYTMQVGSRESSAGNARRRFMQVE
jgi:hypothetical protein